jgi:hypothetical protein
MKGMNFMQKTIAFITLILLIMSMISSCGASHDATGNTAGSPTPPVKNEASGNTDDTTKVDSEDYERKIIKTYHLSLETKNYDSARDAIAAAAQAYGGYISEYNEKYIVNRQGQKDRSASFTVRIPSEKAEAYVSEITKNVSVLSKKLSTEDITTSYYDLQSQLESLAEQEVRIKKLMDEATNYNYLLELDDKLTSIRAQINNISKQIQIYDKSVALSFVYITLDEVVEYTEISEASPSFGKRIADAFT